MSCWVADQPLKLRACVLHPVPRLLILWVAAKMPRILVSLAVLLGKFQLTNGIRMKADVIYIFTFAVASSIACTDR